MDTLTVGLASSEDADASTAGRDAARSALGQLAGRPASLVLVYASVRYHLPHLLAAIRALTGDVPLVGASSSGQLHSGHHTAPGRGVVVLALADGPYRFGASFPSAWRRALLSVPISR